MLGLPTSPLSPSLVPFPRILSCFDPGIFLNFVLFFNLKNLIMCACRGVGESDFPLATPLEKISPPQQPLAAVDPHGEVEPYAKG